MLSHRTISSVSDLKPQNARANEPLLMKITVIFTLPVQYCAAKSKTSFHLSITWQIPWNKRDNQRFAVH